MPLQFYHDSKMFEYVYSIAPLHEQDRLQEHYFKVGDCSPSLCPAKGFYVELLRFDSDLGTYYDFGAGPTFRAFAPEFGQDKIAQGLIRLSFSESYVSIDKLQVFKPAIRSNPNCFIATTVYGDPRAPQVQALRRFRDEVLSQTSGGRAFIDFYYSGAGKATADFIKHHTPSLIPAVRYTLDMLVEAIEKKIR